MASKMDIDELQNEIEYDRFSLTKWSPLASEINREEFLGGILHLSSINITWRYTVRRCGVTYCSSIANLMH